MLAKTSIEIRIRQIRHSSQSGFPCYEADLRVCFFLKLDHEHVKSVSLRI